MSRDERHDLDARVGKLKAYCALPNLDGCEATFEVRCREIIAPACSRGPVLA